MKLVEKLWELIQPEFLKEAATLPGSLSQDEVAQTANDRAEKIGWSGKNVAASQPYLSKEKGKLIWIVRFCPVDENRFPVRSGHLILHIADESGEVIKEFDVRK